MSPESLFVTQSLALAAVRFFIHISTVFKFSKVAICFLIFYTLHTMVAGYYGITLAVCVSIRASACRPSVLFSFPDDNWSKCQWIFTKLGVCIDIVEMWFGIVSGQILSIFDRVICSHYVQIFFSGW